MKGKELRYLSRGQLNDIISEQHKLICHLRNKVCILEERLLISDEPYVIWDPSKRTLEDVLDELGNR